MQVKGLAVPSFSSLTTERADFSLGRMKQNSRVIDLSGNALRCKRKTRIPPGMHFAPPSWSEVLDSKINCFLRNVISTFYVRPPPPPPPPF